MAAPAGSAMPATMTDAIAAIFVRVRKTGKVTDAVCPFMFYSIQKMYLEHRPDPTPTLLEGGSAVCQPCRLYKTTFLAGRLIINQWNVSISQFHPPIVR
jgi:hypothetical protein